MVSAEMNQELGTLIPALVLGISAAAAGLAWLVHAAGRFVGIESKNCECKVKSLDKWCAMMYTTLWCQGECLDEGGSHGRFGDDAAL